MPSTRLIGVVLVTSMGLGCHPSIAEAGVTWSTNAAACVPVSESGLSVTAGAVTALGGSTVTLYCGITPAALARASDSIEITYKGGAGVVSGGANAPPVTAPLPQSTGSVSADLIEMPKLTGAEAPIKCGIKPQGSATIATARQFCEESEVDFSKNFYYLRIIVKSGTIAFQQMTVYGSSLISTP
jgi:hypothetical protein